MIITHEHNMYSLCPYICIYSVWTKIYFYRNYYNEVKECTTFSKHCRSFKRKSVSCWFMIINKITADLCYTQVHDVCDTDASTSCYRMDVHIFYKTGLT